jgi:hypothetical protein
MQKKISFILLCALLVGTNLKLHAATRTWYVNATTTVWTSTANWLEGIVPTDSDSVIIGSSTNYPRVAGIIAKCLHLMFLNNGTSNQKRLLINSGGSLEIYGNLHNDYGYSGVFGSETDNPYLLFKKNSSSPTLAKIYGDVRVGRIKVEKVTGYGLALSAGSHVTIDQYLDISGCTFDATASGCQLLLPTHISGTNEGTSAFIIKGRATGHVVVTAPVAKPAGTYESHKHRYHFLGNPLTDNRPQNQLDKRTGTIADDFAFYNPRVGAHGHPYYNSGYSFPATTSISIFHSGGRNDCAIYPLPYSGNEGDYSFIYQNYYDQAHACTVAMNDQSPFFQYWDESVQDPWHTGSAANGRYGYKGVDSTQTFGKGEGMLTHFGPTALRMVDTTLSGSPKYGYIDWEGSVNDSTFSRTLTWTNNSEPDQDGYHLLGNPYPSPFSLGWFYYYNQAVISPTIGVWVDTSTHTNVNGGYTEYVTVELDPLNDDMPLYPYMINIGQGFWVRVKDSTSGGSAEFNNFQRQYDDFNPYNGPITRKKTQARPLEFSLKLQMSGKTLGIDETKIRFDDDFKQGVDGVQDASKLMGLGNAFLYTRCMDQRLALNSLPFPENRQEIPLEMVVLMEEEITLSAKEFRLPVGYQINLLDKAEKKIYPVQEDFSFTFLPKGSNSANRFALEILPPGSSVPISKTIRFTPFVHQGEIKLKLHDGFTGPASYQVTDISGRILSSGDLSIKGAEVALEKAVYPSGVLFITLVPEGRPAHSQKCLISH